MVERPEKPRPGGAWRTAEKVPHGVPQKTKSNRQLDKSGKVQLPKEVRRQIVKNRVAPKADGDDVDVVRVPTYLAEDCRKPIRPVLRAGEEA